MKGKVSTSGTKYIFVLPVLSKNIFLLCSFNQTEYFPIFAEHIFQAEAYYWN